VVSREGDQVRRERDRERETEREGDRERQRGERAIVRFGLHEIAIPILSALQLDGGTVRYEFAPRTHSVWTVCTNNLNNFGRTQYIKNALLPNPGHKKLMSAHTFTGRLRVQPDDIRSICQDSPYPPNG
jgi:hypothetical protein